MVGKSFEIHGDLFALAWQDLEGGVCNLLQYAIESFSLADNLQQLHQDQFGENEDANSYDARFSMIKQWLSDCCHKHCTCTSQEVPSLPNRVLDVGPADGSQNPCLLLSQGRKGHDITLSYCWGKAKAFSINTPTLNAFEREIPLQNLPRLFRDFVFLARFLELRYIWIDALCIMQDDSNDWEKESAQMCSTYSKADLTLAAAASEDPESPLMRPFVHSLPVIHDGRSFALRIQPVHSAGGAEPLFNRAWTLQEEILSRRVLYFGDRQLRWQCACMQVSEDSILDTVPQFDYSDRK